jgi:hypothetical protein
VCINHQYFGVSWWCHILQQLFPFMIFDPYIVSSTVYCPNWRPVCFKFFWYAVQCSALTPSTISLVSPVLLFVVSCVWALQNNVILYLSNFHKMLEIFFVRYRGRTRNTHKVQQTNILLTFWHLNFILHTLYIKCKNTGPKKGKIMKQTAFWRERNGECAAFF